jgi:hypothetical protein
MIFIPLQKTKQISKKSVNKHTQQRKDMLKKIMMGSTGNNA